MTLLDAVQSIPKEEPHATNSLDSPFRTVLDGLWRWGRRQCSIANTGANRRANGNSDALNAANIGAVTLARSDGLPNGRADGDSYA